MTIKTVFSTLLCVLALTSCSDKMDEKSIDVDAAQVVTLQCEAKQLRAERFEAANQIRLKEEEKLQKGEKITPSDIEKNDVIAKDVTKRTADLASKINTLLDSLWKNKYKTVQQRELLDKAMEKIAAVKCP